MTIKDLRDNSFDGEHTMTFQEYMQRVDEYVSDYPDWRFGQALYNVLGLVRPDLAHELTGSPLDPFYKNPTEVMPFFSWLAARWDG